MMSRRQENSGELSKALKEHGEAGGAPGPLLAPGPGLGWTPAVRWWMRLTAPQLHQSNVDENLVNNQIKKKQGHFI